MSSACYRLWGILITVQPFLKHSSWNLGSAFPGIPQGQNHFQNDPGTLFALFIVLDIGTDDAKAMVVKLLPLSRGQGSSNNVIF